MEKFSPENLLRPVHHFYEKILKEEQIRIYEPKEKKYETDTLVAPGWGKIIPTFENNTFKVLAEKGREVISMDFPRDMRIAAEDGQPQEELQKAYAVIDALKQLDKEPVNAIGHSEGGLYLAIAALLEPERFKNLVLVAPAGMIGKDSFLNLAYRFCIKEGKQSTLPMGEITKALTSYVMHNPARAISEVKALSEADIYDILKELKKKGIGISIVSCTDDDVFMMDKMQEEYGKRKQSGEVKDFSEIADGFYVMKGTHGEFLGHGEHVPAGKFPDAIHQILETLDKKTG